MPGGVPRPLFKRADSGDGSHASDGSDEGLDLDLFLRVFRIDASLLHADVVDRLRAVVKSVAERTFEKGDVVIEQGDAAAASELLVFVEGQAEVHLKPASQIKRPGAAAARAWSPHGSQPAAAWATTNDDPDERRSSYETIDEESDTLSELGLATGGAFFAQDQKRNVQGPEVDVAVVSAPFFVGEARVLRSSWPNATYIVCSETAKTFVLTCDDVLALTAAGGFSLERTLRLRAFERALAKRGACASFLRDAPFVDHFLHFLVRIHEAENLRFLVDVMRFKRENDKRSDFDAVARHFDVVWNEFVQPWGPMANVAAIDVPHKLLETARLRAKEVRAERDASELSKCFDALALRVKGLVDAELLPAFINGPTYSAFIAQRFPLTEDSLAAAPAGLFAAVRIFDHANTTSSNRSSARFSLQLFGSRKAVAPPELAALSSTSSNASNAASTAASDAPRLSGMRLPFSLIKAVSRRANLARTAPAPSSSPSYAARGGGGSRIIVSPARDVARVIASPGSAAVTA
ncbi:hypothetical protein M885DRAFT_532942 [Pelagophyceae sp. CCMP2097]|nr:hypothetical protein M885DRAFT_532942 [Pelagophyceae sp. CCMP2097]